MSDTESYSAREDRIAAAILAYDYIKARSMAERVPFNLDKRFCIKAALAGVQTFFGFTVVVNGDDVSFTDTQEPSKGFLRRWIKNGAARAVLSSN